ncbi:hypothetical protein [Rhodoblastus sp.]|uniref:hypothetical protein n=1 Tax=Rhodoblastus sp. TaxID=1962975 RepID=UPI0026032A95|nr:hypothetical protein [Rhodoblastus sp.]
MIQFRNGGRPSSSALSFWASLVARFIWLTKGCGEIEKAKQTTRASHSESVVSLCSLLR